MQESHDWYSHYLTFASGSGPARAGSLISAYAELTSQLNTEHKGKVTHKEVAAIVLTFSMSRALIMEELCGRKGNITTITVITAATMVANTFSRCDVVRSRFARQVARVVCSSETVVCREVSCSWVCLVETSAACRSV